MQQPVNLLQKLARKLSSLGQSLKTNGAGRAAHSVDNARIVESVPGRVHRFDFMIAGDDAVSAANYNRIGTSACTLIEHGLSLKQAAWNDVDALLDYGCGYGRVTRALIQRLDGSKVSVFDVDPGAVAF